MRVLNRIILRAIRRRNGLTRKDLAAIWGVSVACVGRVERCEEDMTEDMLRLLEESVGAKLGGICTSQ